MQVAAEHFSAEHPASGQPWRGIQQHAVSLCGGSVVGKDISSPSQSTQAVGHTRPTDSQLGLI